MNSVVEDVVKSLDAVSELMPYLPELLADLWALGGSPQLIVELLKSLELPGEGIKCLDLGCGKGAVSIAVAREFGFRVHGIDGFEPFILEAKSKAKQFKVEHLCSFECGDIIKEISRYNGYGLLIMTAVGPVFGDMKSTIEILKQCVKPEGIIMIHDGFIKAKGIVYDGYLNYEETVELIISSGIKLLKEVIMDEEEMKEINRKNTELIRKRAEQLKGKFPEKSLLFDEYIARQEKESEIWGSKMGSAVWVLKYS